MEHLALRIMPPFFAAPMDKALQCVLKVMPILLSAKARMGVHWR